MKENETIDKFQRGKFKSLKKNGIKPNSIGGFDLLRFLQTKRLEVPDLKQWVESV